MKKLWEKPKLVVLVRGRPEEAVLEACKYGYPSTGANSTEVSSCHVEPREDHCGVNCSTYGAT